MSKRITLSDRELYVLATIINLILSQGASTMLSRLGETELQNLRARIKGSDNE